MLYIIHSGQSTNFLVFSVNENPLMSRTEVAAFEESVQSFHTEFPSLTELTAREIIRKNIPNKDTLPHILQGLFRVQGKTLLIHHYHMSLSLRKSEAAVV